LSKPGSRPLYNNVIKLLAERDSSDEACSNPAFLLDSRLIRRPEHLIGRHCGISRQNEGHSFGDHLISESVSITPSSVIEASIVLCSVFMTRVSQCPISLRSEHLI
jgi:hypothetical protein